MLPKRCYRGFNSFIFSIRVFSICSAWYICSFSRAVWAYLCSLYISRLGCRNDTKHERSKTDKTISNQHFRISNIVKFVCTVHKDVRCAKSGIYGSRVEDIVDSSTHSTKYMNTHKMGSVLLTHILWHVSTKGPPLWERSTMIISLQPIALVTTSIFIDDVDTHAFPLN